ncbi:MAG TPA: bifunctional phosphoribosylaminoimidazolecarboxamide formyltransferase/IMP cyclohydrolase [Gammaproteobacteria bacterium]|jgi:phosphoribosylaminoimidazolecarboxamide formyltransferase/IMP cyclohydrolase|nr:bifunctional phosphoribosylaminoimidazolecarboxamide formyltransferase/IMP cyclohydrolase [Gammaproteobacteria bacterium]HIK72017.1 bifunctional phosphoribosylaminoimidazolecarboxamide formyltransferase/IMP cyclohydrolase [Gammaproteobacteria bacterium]
MASAANPKIRRALISVSNKEGLVELCSELVNKFGIEIISTGGTLKTLLEGGVKAIDISEYTGFPEMMDGRVKTLHPKVHGGILARREIDQKVMDDNGIKGIDLVVVNLYPFVETISKPETTLEVAIENIDIGGPSMLRSAAKNNKYVGVVVDPLDYNMILKEMEKTGGTLSHTTRSNLATKAFTYTASYDSAISAYLSSQNKKEDFPDQIFGKFQRKELLRYGENPHQKAAFYTDFSNQQTDGVSNSTQLQGKKLSYNNIADTDAAYECVKAFDEPACVIVKHANPCGIATDKNITKAYEKSFASDSTSAFGGIVALNRELNKETAERIISNQFVEVIIAPGISDDAFAITKTKENVRVLNTKELGSQAKGFKLLSVTDGLLIQETDNGIVSINDLTVVSKRKPTDLEIKNCLFAWKVCKFVKSNAIVYTKDNQTIGIGAGQMSRIDSAKIAASKAKEGGFQTEGCSMASDAFFPFRDGIDAAAEIGISSIIQPGGSMRDNEVIEAADEANMAMLFTGVRHFRH